MKQLSKAILALLVSMMLFASCDLLGITGDSSSGTRPGGAGREILIALDNSENPFRVTVYQHSVRQSEHRIAPGGRTYLRGGESWDINLPWPDSGLGLQPEESFPLFLRYSINVEGHFFPLDHWIERSVSANIRETFRIPHPSELPWPDTISNCIFLYIQNNHNGPIRLFSGNSIVSDQSGRIITINPNQTSLFTTTNTGVIRPGSTANLRVGPGFTPADGSPFPAGLSVFEPGHIYFLEFDGSALTVAREPVAITLGNASWGGTGWTADANPASTSSITITFDDPVFGLTTDDITIADGSGAAIKGALTGSGTSWSLDVAVTTPGYVRVLINRPDIERLWHQLEVHPITWTATADTTRAHTINFTFSQAISELMAADIILGDGGGAAERGELTGSGRSWSLAAYVTRPGIIEVSIARPGIKEGPLAVSVMLPLTGTVSISGTARVGERLTADTSALGGSGGSIAFQWVRGNTLIAGESGSGYNVRIMDVSRHISVTVSRQGYIGSITSAATSLVPVPGDDLREQLSWLLSNASSTHYTIEVGRNYAIPPQVLSRASGRSNVSIALRGIGEARAISLTQNGALFTLGSGVTLELESITLNGRPSNNSPLVRINNGGTLIMSEGANITGNIGGGAVNMVGGVFVMHAGTISGNRGSPGGFGGVNVGNGSRFTMYGGTISGNHGGAGVNGGVGNVGSHGTSGNNNNGGTGGIGSPGHSGGTGGVNISSGGAVYLRGGAIRGNHGGVGGTGGAGGRGGNGHSRSSGSLGANGGAGGRGGFGGAGGSGGPGGVNVGPGGRFTLDLGTVSENHGGAGGSGGRGGDGGAGGSGGIGGSRGRNGYGGVGGNGSGGGIGGVTGVLTWLGGNITANSGGGGGSAGGGGSGHTAGTSGSSGTPGRSNM